MSTSGDSRMMEPTRTGRATLNDLLDRVLDKGLVLDADIVICLAGIPLLGVKLRAALAGMETMVKFGIMKDIDQSIREQTQKQIETKKILLSEKEVTRNQRLNQPSGTSISKPHGE